MALDHAGVSPRPRLFAPAPGRRALLAGLASAACGAAPAACERLRIPLAPGGLLVEEHQGQARGVLVSVIAALQRLEAQGRLSWVRDVGTALRMVLAGRVDFSLSSPTVAYSYAGAQASEALRMDVLPGVRPLETGAAVSRRSFSPAAQEAVLAALRAVVRAGEVQQAFARHFPAAVRAREPLALRRA